MSSIKDQQDFYADIGFSNRIGFGQRPAVIVIDMCRGITEQGNKMFIDMGAAFAPISTILDAARAVSAPVIFTTVAYHQDRADAGTFGQKVPLVQDLVQGSPLVDIDPRLPVLASDHLIVKKFPSSFYSTHLQSLLTGQGIDTTILVGNSTSGCVRATAVDAVSGGFRVIVPGDCVADRVALSHQVNLFDIDSKYGDVVSSEEVVKYLCDLGLGLATAAPSLRFSA